MRWIANNAGQEGNMVVAKVRRWRPRWASTPPPSTYENLIEAGVIDPTKVVRFAIQNAASIAALMLTTEAIVAEIPEKKKDAADASGWRDGRLLMPARSAVLGGRRSAPAAFRWPSSGPCPAGHLLTTSALPGRPATCA